MHFVLCTRKKYFMYVLFRFPLTRIWWLVIALDCQDPHEPSMQSSSIGAICNTSKANKPTLYKFSRQNLDRFFI